MISLIAAVDSKNGLAKNGHEPWDIPADLKYFYSTISHGSSVLMGFTTYSRMGHALKNRTNYVLSREHTNQQLDDAVVISDLTKFMSEFDGDLWVIGGASIYAQTIDFADQIYLTRIDHDFGCDQFFPELPEAFKLASSKDETDSGFKLSYQVYVR